MMTAAIAKSTGTHLHTEHINSEHVGGRLARILPKMTETFLRDITSKSPGTSQCQAQPQLKDWCNAELQT